MNDTQMYKVPDFWYKYDNTSMSRKLRLAVIHNIWMQGRITEDQAKELLNGPLSPGDESTAFDDSEWLNGIERAA